MASNYAGNEVEFNDAFTQVQRLNYWQQVINFSFTSLLSKDQDTGLYFYEVGFNALNNLFHEISADLSEDELKECKAYINILKKIIKDRTFFRQITDNSFGNRKGKATVLNKELFDFFEEKLEDYRLYINKVKKKHGYSNPTKQSSASAMMR